MPRLLLVEDNEMNRDMLSRRLGRKGFAVAIAVDGPGGLDAARSGSFDLILMDLSLPGVDGWEAIRRLKADPATRPIPIIALTAHAMAGDRERALDAGCDDYEIKPVEFPRLLAKIEAHLRPGAAATAARTPGRVAPGAASLLRHDLIAPINHILGYCDLLVDDAEARGRAFRSQGLRSVRSLGKQALGAIDRALDRAADGGRPVDVAALGHELRGPAAAIGEACNAIEEASSRAPDRRAFLEDLAKIREAAARLALMAGQMVENPGATPA